MLDHFEQALVDEYLEAGGEITVLPTRTIEDILAPDFPAALSDAAQAVHKRRMDILGRLRTGEGPKAISVALGLPSRTVSRDIKVIREMGVGW